MTAGRGSVDQRVFGWATENRRTAADLIESLDDRQLASDSLCAGWSIRVLAAHLVMPMLVSFRTVGLEAVRQRGSLDRACDVISRRLAHRPVTEIVAELRAHAADRLAPPVLGPLGPYTDSVVHLRDMARPLGLDADVSGEQWRTVLDFLVSKKAAMGFVPKRRLAGLRLVATDQDWAWGSGPTLSGPAEALGMAAAGRAVALGDLTGDGVPLLQARLTSAR